MARVPEGRESCRYSPERLRMARKVTNDEVATDMEVVAGCFSKQLRLAHHQLMGDTVTQ